MDWAAPHAASGCLDLDLNRRGWASGHDPAIGTLNRDRSGLAEGQHPAGVMNLVMVMRAQRRQVLEVGASTMSPPGDMVNVTVPERHRTVGNDAGRVEAAQSLTLRSVGEPGGSAKVQLLGTIQKRSVAGDVDHRDPWPTIEVTLESLHG